MKKLISLILVGAMALSLAACGGNFNKPAPTAPRTESTSDETQPASTAPIDNDTPDEEIAEDLELSDVQEVIRMAQEMSMEELAARAIFESNGKAFTGLGTSSQAESAMSKFVDYLRTFNSTYTLDYHWQEPKDGNIVTPLAASSAKAESTYSVVLAADGTRAQSQLVDNNIVSTFVPKEWLDNNGMTAEDFQGFLPLRTVVKTFDYKISNGKTYNSCWDFVAENVHGYCRDMNLDASGRNFLLMLTRADYAAMIRESFESMVPERQEPYLELIEEMQPEAEAMGLNEDGAYALAWIKLWVESFNAQPDDDSILKLLLTQYNVDSPVGVLDVSALRLLPQLDNRNVNSLKAVAFEPAYYGFSGFSFNEYLFVPNNSPMPWTACAFIAYITCTIDGFSAWGKDMGSYTCNRLVAREIEAIYHHSTDDPFSVGNIPDLEWWENQSRLVAIDPEYCASVDFTFGSWIDLLTRYEAPKPQQK